MEILIFFLTVGQELYEIYNKRLNISTLDFKLPGTKQRITELSTCKKAKESTVVLTVYCVSCVKQSFYKICQGLFFM